MANNSVYKNNTLVVNVEDPIEIFRAPWLSGIVVSWIGLLIQIGFFILVPPCRKYDEKLLTMLSVSRILNTMCEYVISNMEFTYSAVIKDIVYTVYFQSDFALVCWMFVFSKNLYDKVVLVFTLRKFNLVTISLIIWLSTLPIGLISPFILTYYDEYFMKYYNTYSFVKFVIIAINALIFIEIFAVAYKRGSNTTRHYTHFIKAAVVSFILVCVTSLQVFTTDLLSMFLGKNALLINTFCVINSFQVVTITGIFLILARRKINDSAFKSMTVRFRDIVT